MKIGFIGLGNMGLPMAINLLKAGHEVTGFDLVQGQIDAFAKAGGKVAKSANATADGADVAISMSSLADAFAKSKRYTSSDSVTRLVEPMSVIGDRG